MCLLYRSKDIRLPFPYQYYLELIKKIIRFIEICQVTEDVVRADWLWIAKCVLYLEHKKIDFESFSTYFFNNDKLKHQLAEVSLEELGPIDCPITTIFCLIHPSKKTR